MDNNFFNFAIAFSAFIVGAIYFFLSKREIDISMRKLEQHNRMKKTPAKHVFQKVIVEEELPVES
jgi:hypothetical protein